MTEEVADNSVPLLVPTNVSLTPKAILNGQLKTVRNNLLLGVASYCLLNDSPSNSRLAKMIVNFDSRTIKCDQLAERLKNDKDRTFLTKEFLKNVFRSTTNATFELILDYANKENKLPLLQSQTWYQFARVIRNSVSHTNKFEFRGSIKKLLPIKWSGIEIAELMEGEDIGTSNYNFEKAMELFEAMYVFAIDDNY